MKNTILLSLVFLLSASLAFAGGDTKRAKTQKQVHKSQPVKMIPVLEGDEIRKPVINEAPVVATNPAENEENIPENVLSKDEKAEKALRGIINTTLPKKLAGKLNKKLDKQKAKGTQEFHIVTKITFLAGIGVFALGTLFLILGIALGSGFLLYYGIVFMILGFAAVTFAIIWELIKRN